MSLVIRDEDILLDINGEGSTIEETEDIAESIRNLIN